MKKILICSLLPQRFPDLLVFYNELVKGEDENFQVLFFFGKDVLRSYPSKTAALSHRVLNSKIVKGQESFTEKKNNGKRNRLKETLKKINILSLVWDKLLKLLRFLKETLLFDWYWECLEAKELKKLHLEYNQINPLFEIHKIDLIFLEGDRHMNIQEPVFLKISMERQIPVILPYLVFPTEEESLIRSSKNKMIRQKWYTSHYILDAQKRFMGAQRNNKYYYPHAISNALYRFGVLSENPWYMGSGKITALCLPNQYMVSKYISNGIPRTKTLLLGDISYDRLFQNFIDRNKLRKKVFKKYDLDFSRKCFIIALPQLAEHDILDWDDHWDEINFLLESLTSLNINLLISLHPKMDFEKYCFLESKFNCHILEERLVDVLPMADLFLGTFTSTVFWSVLCGIKTIIVDFYNLNLSAFDFLNSVLIIKKKALFLKGVDYKLKEQTDFSADWEKLSREEVFDGRTINRYKKLIIENV